MHNIANIRNNYFNSVVVLAARLPPSSFQIAVGSGSALRSTVRVILAFSGTLALGSLAADITGSAINNKTYKAKCKIYY